MRKLIILSLLSCITLGSKSVSPLPPSPTYVYVCTGPYADKYHSRPNCSGLNRCSGEVVKITLAEAKKGQWKLPCQKCH